MERSIARETLKEHLQTYVESITQKSKGHNMYTCPLCNSGSGRNGTGAFSIKNGTSWKCFSCNEGGDIFDLIGKVEGLSEYTDQLKRASELFNISLDTYTQPYTHKDIHTTAYTHTHTDKEEAPEQDYTSFFLQANKSLSETDYPLKRGLSLDTLNRFKVGYIANYEAHNKGAKGWSCLIIPTSKTSYVIRNTDTEADKGNRYRKQGSTHLFNTKALKEPKKPIFVVEGELDALSIIEVGGEAVGLGSTSNIRAFIELCKSAKPSQPFIICLDNDDTGRTATNELINGLKPLNIECYIQNIAGEYKDCNEALQHDREGFKLAVSEAEHIKDEAERVAKENYLATSTAHHLQSFIDGIAESVNTPFIPTGFNNLDTVLDGGLYEGLYIVGAISSLGKTTFVTQIADQIAQAGTDVLIFSLEMARAEIMAKSISRHTAQHIISTGGDMRNAKTTRGITTGKRYINYNQAEKELIQEAVKQYGSYAGNIYISEGIGDIGVKQIRETIKNHILFTGKTPIVIIDYLQILAPYSEKMTDKQNTDKAVMELKRISRDFKASVIGISSFNRSSYKEAVTMEAFKESGAIEYSSDVLIGLQLKGVGTREFDVNKAKASDCRAVELVMLKNRNGATGKKVAYNYYPMFNYFKEAKEG